MAKAYRMIIVLLNLLVTDVLAQVQSRSINSTQGVCTAKYTPKRGKPYCDYRATLEAPSVISGYPITSVFNSCRNRCILETTCKAFSFNENTQVCYIYNKNLVQMSVQRKNSSDTYYYDRQCWKAISYYETAPVVNSGFETGSLSPWTIFMTRGNDTTISIADQGANGSSYSAQATFQDPPNNSPSSSGGEMIISNQFNVCQGVNYTFVASFYQPPLPANIYGLPVVYISVADPANDAKLLIADSNQTTVYDSANNYNFVGNFSAGQWNTITIATFTADVTGNYTMYLDARSGGNGGPYNLYFDNFIVQALPQ